MQAWDEFLKLQEARLGSETVNKWLRTLKIVRFDACNLHLQASDSFQCIWFEEHVRPEIEKHLFNNNQKPIKVHLVAPTPKKPPLKPNPKKEGDKESSSEEFVLRFDQLDENARFDTFVTDRQVNIAVSLLAETTGYDLREHKLIHKGQRLGQFNPIYLFGPSGSGKTHLLMAAAHALKEQGVRVLYSRAETFTEHVVSAIRSGQMQQFRKHYRNIDVLIVDDVQVFSGKTATQEEFFHTFNTLHVEGKQIILSASCPPQELKSVEVRLISRFEWGIALPLDNLTRFGMEKALDERCKRLSLTLKSEVQDFLMRHFQGSMSALNRALNALVLRIHMRESQGEKIPTPLDLETAQDLLEDLVKDEQKKAITPQKIVQFTAEYYGIRPEDILGKSQSRECALPRQIAMHLMRQVLHIPFKKIGALFSRDHSTVMASVKQIQRAVDEKNIDLLSALSSLHKKLL